MRKRNLYTNEIIKTEYATINTIYEYIRGIYFRKYILSKKIDEKNKYKYIKETFNTTKKTIKEIYKVDFEYMYSTTISYFIAIKLYEIYKQDKEKCFYLINQLLLDNNFLTTKLQKYNINILEESNYIKQLKKEYTINNQ